MTRIDIAAAATDAELAPFGDVVGAVRPDARTQVDVRSIEPTTDERNASLRAVDARVRLAALPARPFVRGPLVDGR